MHLVVTAFAVPHLRPCSTSLPSQTEEGVPEPLVIAPDAVGCPRRGRRRAATGTTPCGTRGPSQPGRFLVLPNSLTSATRGLLAGVFDLAAEAGVVQHGRLLGASSSRALGGGGNAAPLLQQQQLLPPLPSPLAQAPGPSQIHWSYDQKQMDAGA